MVSQITAITVSVAIALSAVRPAFAQEDASVKRGLYVSVIGGCHDCHTEGYRESGGKIDADKAMKGDATVGWRSPQGIAYAANLRLFAFLRDEDASSTI